MAKWGEGDPRWIVEERPDATNVNNWHWSEKDASLWSKEKLKNVLVGMEFDGAEGKCMVEEASKLQGEATAHNRKGKLIFFYEWHITLKWSGQVREQEKKVTGEIDIPNLSDENDVEEVDVTITANKSDKAEGQLLKGMLHVMAPPLIREKLLDYLRCLKEEYSNKGLILPRRPSEQLPSATLGAKIQPQTNSLPNSNTTSDHREKNKTVGCRINTTKISLTDSFMTSIEEIYNTLTTQELVTAFTNSPAKLDARKGGPFSIMDGLITGQYMELERPTKIVQKWRQKSWPEAHYSTVTIQLKQLDSTAELVLSQTEVPESDAERTREGWKSHIFARIKSTFGFGAHLF